MVVKAVELRHLKHIYKTDLLAKPRQALVDLNLEVEEGEIYGYLGTNGAGKTTTIKILVGLLRQSGGSALVFGKESRDVHSRARIGYQPENPYFYEYLNAREALEFYAALSDVPVKQRKNRSEELLEFVGLRDAADERIRNFSKGMRQRLGIAQAVIHRPGLVILDEPMSGLDPVGRMQVRQIISDLHQQGLTVFFSSHILADVELICTRVGLLLQGRLECAGPVDSLVSARVKGIDIVAAQVPEDLPDRLKTMGIHFRYQGEQLCLHCADRIQSDQAVACLIDSGAVICSLIPQRETLEEYFMRVNRLSRMEVGSWKGGADQ